VEILRAFVCLDKAARTERALSEVEGSVRICRASLGLDGRGRPSPNELLHGYQLHVEDQG